MILECPELKRIVSGVCDTHGAAQKPTEFGTLLEMIYPLCPLSRVLEIGTAGGGTLWAWLQLGYDGATVISVDNDAYHAKSLDIFRSWARREGCANQTLELIREDSHSPDALRRVQEILDGEKVDLLHIDGDHSYDGVQLDWEMYSPLVSGVVVFHDINTHSGAPEVQVKAFWDKVKADYPHVEIIDPRGDRGWGADWAGIGVLFKP